MTKARVIMLFAAVLACSWACAFGIRDRDLIGWSEDKRTNPDDARRQDALVTENMAARGIKVLSWEPRIFLYRGLLTDMECDHLVKKAQPRMERSGVVEEGGGDGISDIRTSDGMFFDRAEDALIERIENKLSEWTLIPAGNGEGLQLLRYRPGQEYQPHFDYFFHESGINNGGNRLATVLMYLATPESGGETVFPNVDPPPEQTIQAGFSECSMKGLAVRPVKGDAVLFWSLRTDGTLDKGSLHGSCPVTAGVKYAATKWYHVAHYAMGGEKAQTVKHVVFRPPPAPAPPGCRDLHKECPGWAEGGECEGNPKFMVGTKEAPGDCLLSCGRCDLMKLKNAAGR